MVKLSVPLLYTAALYTMCGVRYEVRGHLLFVYSAEEATVGTYHCVMITKDNRIVTGDAKLGLVCCSLNRLIFCASVSSEQA